MLEKNTQSLLREITSLRTRIQELIAVRDELKFRTCENLEDEYQKKLGSLEYRAFLSRYRTLRIQHEIDLIRKQMTEEGYVFLPAIQSKLDEEFRSSISQCRGRKQRILLAERHEKMNRLMGTNEENLAALYREVCEKIHPDLNPYGNSPEPELFFQAVEAYRDGCEYKLSQIATLLEEVPPLPYPFEYASIQLISDAYHERVMELIQSIADIQNSYPYNVQDVLDDQLSLFHMQQRLYNETESWDRAYEAYETERMELLTGKSEDQ